MNNEGISVQVWNNHFESNGPGLENPDNYVAALTASGDLSVLDVFNNDFINNTGFAVSHNDGGEQESTILCEGNYWGHESGPWHEIQNPDGLGDSVTSELDILPFSVQPLNAFTPPDSFVLLWPEDQTSNDTLPVRFAWEAATDSQVPKVVYFDSVCVENRVRERSVAK